MAVQMYDDLAAREAAEYAMTRALYYVKAAQQGATIPRLEAAQALLEAALAITERTVS